MFEQSFAEKLLTLKLSVYIYLEKCHKACLFSVSILHILIEFRMMVRH